MQLIKKQERLGEIAFLVGVFIHLLIMVIGYGEWNVPFSGRLMQIAFVCFCVKIVLTYYTKIEWISMVALGIVGAASYFYTSDEYVVGIAVMIFAAKNTDMRRICKWILILTLISTVVTAFLSLCGIGGTPVDIRDYGRGGQEARWCLGFGHANNFHGTIWYMMALTVYLYFEKMDWKYYLLLTIANVFFFYFTISKGGLIAAQLVIIAACLLRHVKSLGQKTWIYLCGFLALAGVFIISIISVSVEWTKSPILLFLDRIFTGRINLAYQHANISTWKLLSCAGEYGDPVDNGWVTIFFEYGYVIGVVFVLFHLYLIYVAWKEKNSVLLAIIVTCIFYTFMEATYTMNKSYLLSNLSYIAAMILMAGKKELDNESKRLKNQNN